ncbi:hypothetical protein JW721_05975 [Candidatus Micrarchaeota archaeon]|nr:hypothetical protein [Candidatus Micrarchaeota archaeon]
MNEQIDGMISDFALYPWKGPQREQILRNAEAVEERLFELLEMDDAEFARSKPAGVHRKEDVANIIMRLFDSRENGALYEPPSTLAIIDRSQSIDYDSATRIIQRLRKWNMQDEKHNFQSVGHKLGNAVEYLEIAHTQEVCIELLRDLILTGIRHPPDLRKRIDIVLGPAHDSYGKPLEFPIIMCISNEDIRKAILKGDEAVFGRAVVNISNQMREWGVLPTRRAYYAPQPSLGSVLGKIGGLEYESGEAAEKILYLWSIQDERGRKRFIESAAESVLARIGKPGASEGDRRELRGILESLAGEVGDVKVLRCMKQVGCSLPESAIKCIEEGAGISKPIGGGRRKLRRELVQLPDGDSRWEVGRKKGKHGMTQSEKREMRTLEKEGFGGLEPDGRIDMIISDCNNAAKAAGAREEALANARKMEDRMFALLNMDDAEFSRNAPNGIKVKATIVYILLRLTDARGNDRFATENRALLETETSQVVDYESAMRIARRLREWDSGPNGRNALSDVITNVEAYRKAAREMPQRIRRKESGALMPQNPAGAQARLQIRK